MENEGIKVPAGAAFAPLKKAGRRWQYGCHPCQHSWLCWYRSFTARPGIMTALKKRQSIKVAE
jgi:hypothetical protein